MMTQLHIYIYYYYDSRLIAIPEKEGIKSNVPPLKSCFDFVNIRCFYNSFMIRYWFRLLSTNNALWPFQFRKLEIGKFKIKISFSSFVSDQKYLKCWDDCRFISQQIYKRTISNLIRKNRMWWICWGPIELASKNLAKYLFDEKIGKKYLEDICSMDWQKCNCELFFSARPTCTTHQISYLSDSTLTFFCK